MLHVVLRNGPVNSVKQQPSLCLLHLPNQVTSLLLLPLCQRQPTSQLLRSKIFPIFIASAIVTRRLTRASAFLVKALRHSNNREGQRFVICAAALISLVCFDICSLCQW